MYNNIIYALYGFNLKNTPKSRYFYIIKSIGIVWLISIVENKSTFSINITECVSELNGKH